MDIVKKGGVSCSMIIDGSPGEIYNSSQSDELAELSLSKIQSRSRSTWVDDKAAKNCFQCKIPFTFYTRHHHCRKCGNAFCYRCSSKTMYLPKYGSGIPSEPSSLKKSINKLLWTNEKVRVCDCCANEIVELKNMETLFDVFDVIPLTINGYRKIRKVCRVWGKVGNFYLSKFREIQYKLPYQEFDAIERFMLNNNKEYLQGHPMWYLAIVNSGIDLPKLQAPKKCRCTELMCSRICTGSMSGHDILTLLISSRDKANFIKELLLQFSDIPENQLICYLNLLIEEMVASNQDCSQIYGRFLVALAKKSVSIAGVVYWGWKIKLESLDLTVKRSTIINMYKTLLLNNVDEKTLKYIQDSEALVIFLNSLSKNTELDIVKELFLENKALFTDTRIPTAPHLICKAILIDEIKIKSSSSAPIFLPLLCVDENTNIEQKYYLLYKFEDVRKDQIIIDTIRIMDTVLQSELQTYTTINTPINIITYNVFPTSRQSGIIEIIPDCHTLYEIQKEFSILNYILEHNRDNGLTVDELRSRFVHSCAAYCVMTYLLGVGDRHLDNIMVNNEGYLFHIDYGFIIGSDPKPMTYPSMRITSDMVDAIGGPKSESYKEFVQLSKDIHLCLQKRLPCFYTMLKLLVTIKPPIQGDKITERLLINELTSRFMYGESYEQAGIRLSVHISNSSSSYKQAINDFFHYHGRENTVNSALKNAKNWVGSWLG